ncbi:hypothetical protein NADFUDRAFT_81370 [Nadsonia fulvescens var. elongata DSM 6958]|uniref:Pyridoxamine 5'-phosphate oxidase N-terminal domain-containing protein n=1 Tax=Nadsonia fulvescens var. elongata DSM 6958 TaxID=857566 RepID=A0A1E3PSI7_9ASCO|nr:hypothetical protein NADFUDRAFT_81370 [Nadsonia fulvescens var. elongata DSM 6958]
MSTGQEHQFPPEVNSLLQSARFLHLATCSNNQPNVSLMNYTYLPESSSIILTASKDSQKFKNIIVNPQVSILVHDWTTSKATLSASSLCEFLQNLNHSEASKNSVTLYGIATVLEGEKAEQYKEKHADNNPADAKSYIDGNFAVVEIKLKGGKIADNKNHVSSY